MLPRRRKTVKPPDPKLRRTLTGHVADSMVSAKRISYYQRLVFVGKMLDKKSPGEVVQELRKFFAVANAHKEDKVSGLMMVDTHMVGMIEGPEDCLTRFLQILSKAEGIIGVTKVVLVYNNANQRFFDKIYYKTDPFSSTALARSILTTDPGKLVQNFVKRHYDRCSALAEDINGQLDPSLMPSSAMCDLIITISIIQPLSEYLSYFQNVELPRNYTDRVWPAPGDSTPYYAANPCPFDVNLIFEKEMAEMSEIIYDHKSQLTLNAN